MHAVVHDSSLFRFLYSYENRSIAKRVLKESGLKKIKLGIEGFPTFAERTRRNANGDKVEGRLLPELRMPARNQDVRHGLA